MNYFLPVFWHLLLASVSVVAQSDNFADFSSDRPGFSTPPDILTLRKIQLENGIQYSKFTNGNTCNENYLFSSLLVRYGFVGQAELRLEADYAYNIETDSAGKSIIYGVTPVTIGTKIRLIRQHKVIPNLSFMFNLTLPFIGTRELRPENLAPAFYLLMSNDLTEKLNLCYNYGVRWDGNSVIPIHFYAVCLGIRLSSKLSTFIEGYGFAATHTLPAFYMDAGLAYMMNDHLQGDISLSGYLNSFRDYVMVNIGIAWRIPY